MSVIFLSAFLACGSPGALKPCQPSMPQTLAEDIAVLFPSAKIMTLPMLERGDRRAFLDQHPGKCPGVAALDFFGDGREMYALVLSQPRPKAADQSKTFIGSHEAILLLARLDQTGKWAFQLLERGNDPTAVVVAMPPDDYEDVYGDSVVHAKHHAIGFGVFDSWFVVYAWNGSSIEKVWLSD